MALIVTTEDASTEKFGQRRNAMPALNEAPSNGALFYFAAHRLLETKIYADPS